MHRLAPTACAILALTACRPAAEAPATPAANAPAASTRTTAPAADPLRLACDAGFRPDMTEDQLRERFGAANVTRGDIYVGEGQNEPGTILFAGDPTRRTEVLWVDAEARMRINQIVISEGATAWTGPGGLRVGAPLAEVERVNGRPFTLSGFEWDYGGIVQSFGGGTLAATDAAQCTAGVRFTLGPNPGANAASGDSEFRSNSAEVRAANAVVSQLHIGWPSIQSGT